ncbi:hypothetical protein GHT06_005848 [Daphnia sinensis]|uniref:Uncharacterized protein n=1 Tax=Daphnia sinensis TaxID=1820382 RepID=A0AAD5PMB4_9CRUS|nr:hypothetical protein GHT06_005848 [Daphnia sinensis]
MKGGGQHTRFGRTNAASGCCGLPVGVHYKTRAFLSQIRNLQYQNQFPNPPPPPPQKKKIVRLFK